MNKRNLVALCAIAAAALTFSSCNESVEYSATEPTCGNGEIETGEVCDVTVPDAMTCAEFDNTKVWSSGKPGCSSECKLTQGSCTEVVSNTCGNSIIDAGETCDGANFNGKTCNDYVPNTMGTLSCSSTCNVVTTGCTPVVDEKCGNGVKDEGEDCDASVEGAAAYMCVDHDSTKYSGGVMACNACKWDASSCTEIVVDEKCGNGALDEGEDCEEGIEITATCSDVKGEGYWMGSLSCSSSCKFVDTGCIPTTGPDCGNGFKDENEECDESADDYAPISCVEHDSSKYSEGSVSCKGCKWDVSECTEITVDTCGNGKLDEGEDCDDTVEGYTATSCVEHDSSLYSAGDLKCTSCKWDTSECTEITVDDCGNGKLDEGEDCDDTVEGYTATSCVEHDSSLYSAGDLSCNSCKWDTSACTEITVDEYDYNVVLDWAKNTTFAKIAATDFIVNDAKIASISGYGAINDNTTENYYDGFNGSTVTFTGNKKYNCHVLIKDIVGGVKEFAFDYRRWLPQKTDGVTEGTSTIQVLVDGEVVMDDIKLDSPKLTTIKVTVDKEDAQSIKIQVKDPQKTRSIQRAVVGNFRWSKK